MAFTQSDIKTIFMRSFKKLKVMAVLSAFIFTGMAAVKQSKIEGFKNLQVLPKNIAADSLDRIMDGFSNGLGVTCNYCHVHNKKLDMLEFEKDDKPEKEIGRNMLRMTFELNKKYFYFNEEVRPDSLLLIPVTCFTCHRGEPRPVTETGTKK